ncbi:MAG TPA: porphobilinogen synthase [Thermoplasmata archaeon]|nr:porphobilinogen synthase [Thermoplasmata archaeon]
MPEPARTARAPGPRVRPRRLRRSPVLRGWAAGAGVDLRRLVYPIFVRPTKGPPDPIPNLDGILRRSVADAIDHAVEAHEAGVPAVLLFGLARRKDAQGSEAWSPTGAVPEAVRGIKRERPGLVVATDVCLCAYTTHGHCGVLQGEQVDNDPTVERLGRVASVHAKAGADLVGPSAMMDHQVAGVRAALDAGGHAQTAILAYAAKFASVFYGPFRDVADSAPAFGDRRGYQLDVRDGRGADQAVALAVEEGADIVMVKPALPALDIINRARFRHRVPIAAYQVSGEYAMIRAAAAAGAFEERAAVEESLAAIRRAGADLIVTYFALQVARWAGGRDA